MTGSVLFQDLAPIYLNVPICWLFFGLTVAILRVLWLCILFTVVNSPDRYSGDRQFIHLYIRQLYAVLCERWRGLIVVSFWPVNCQISTLCVCHGFACTFHLHVPSHHWLSYYQIHISAMHVTCLLTPFPIHNPINKSVFGIDLTIVVY